MTCVKTLKLIKNRNLKEMQRRNNNWDPRWQIGDAAAFVKN